MHYDYIPTGKYHLTVQYGMDGMRRQVYLSRALVLLIGIVALLLLLLSISFFFNLRALRSIRTDLAQAKAENEQLLQKFEVYAALIDSLFVRQGLSADLLPSPDDLSDDIFPFFEEDKPKIIPFADDPAFQNRIFELEQKLVYLTHVYSVQSPILTDLEIMLPEKISNDNSIPSIYPTFGRISDGWGMRIHPFTGNWEFHKGIDIANEVGTPVYATAAGRVVQVTYKTGYGKLICIEHDSGYETRYAHLYSFQVRIGDVVTKGQIIGLMGNTGFSTGPHLHYEVIYQGNKINPVAYLNRIDDDLYTRR